MDDVGVGVAGDEAAVDPSDDVALPDAGAGRRAARSDGLHVDGLVARQDQPVAGRVADHQQVPESEGRRNGSETNGSVSSSLSRIDRQGRKWFFGNFDAVISGYVTIPCFDFVPLITSAVMFCNASFVIEPD